MAGGVEMNMDQSTHSNLLQFEPSSHFQPAGRKALKSCHVSHLLKNSNLLLYGLFVIGHG